MAVFNQSFFDLNNKRCYCLQLPDAAFPLELISDLKISVPNQTEIPAFCSIFVKDACVRITITAGGTLILSYTSDDREFVRIGRLYPLKNHAAGYDGVIAFGAGLRRDHDFKSDVAVSEECITRYRPSRIPYVSLTCIRENLVGDVSLGGGSTDLVQSDKIEDFSLIPSDDVQKIRIDLVDTFRLDSENPMIRFANGINSYNKISERSPVYTIGNVHPDETGTVILQFEDHFRLTGIVNTLGENSENEGEPEIIAAAVCSDITQADVCGTAAKISEGGGETDDTCDIKEVQIEVVPYE